MPNPYSATTNLVARPGIFTESAELIRSAFLYRIIRIFPGDADSPWAAPHTDKPSYTDKPSHTDKPLTDRPPAADSSDREQSSQLIIYSGWWFWQRILVDGQRVWSQISWLSLARKIEFQIPGKASGAPPSQSRIEIEFGPGLRIRRFRLWVNDRIALDEIV